jgi:hypothetical protein
VSSVPIYHETLDMFEQVSVSVQILGFFARLSSERWFRVVSNQDGGGTPPNGFGNIGDHHFACHQQSEYDPIAFGIAAISILIAVVGISIVFKSEPDDTWAKPSVS